MLTKEIDDANAKQRHNCVGVRLFTFLESVQQFSSVVDTFVSSNPSIAALVWGSIKFTFLVSLLYTSTLDPDAEYLRR